MQYGIIKPWAFLLQETHGLPNLYQFMGYHCPFIIDRRFGIDDTAPGKAAIYVRTDIPQEQIDTSQWCTQRQELVAVLVRRKQTKVILVSVYRKPGSARLNFGWIQHLCRRYLHVPVLVGGDFNAPHTSWGYATDSGRGRQVYSRFRDSSYVLLNEAHVSTRPLTAPNTPDLTWWQGHGLPRWTAEPDCWGSDHTPIHIHLSHHLVKKQRRMTKVINWTELRTSTTLEGATADSIKLELKQVVHKHTTEQTVNQDQPNPDLHLIRLWDQQSHKETSYIEKIQQLPPRSFSCLTTNKTSRRKARQNPKAHNPNPSSPDHCILYTDAACTQNGGATAFVSRSHPHLDDQKKFATSDASPLLLELQAIYEALLAASKDHSIAQVTIFTDSAQAIRHLKQTKQAMNIVQKIHRLRHHFAGMVVIDWVQGHGPAEGNIAAHEAAKRAAQSEDLQSHTLPMDLVATLLATKTRIRASTRALIPPCTARVPPGLSGLQEVLLRRIRTGCAITPAVLSSWRGDHSRIPPAFPHCPAPADQVDVRHLIWTCPGIRADREHYVLQAGIRWDDPEAYKTWTTNNACARSILDFAHTAGLPAFL
ncbi:hypothetical protein HPB47_014978 [Ixodes persulcatus]|uniref:Uncharacterized protein n=1 Tax=Ixodes persulcatus TaxID=34615 RepID=A0AC60QVK6_IXOPE|nr:hypothetical protein HPB47_014978 [Ixodes persulcatus]